MARKHPYLNRSTKESKFVYENKLSNFFFLSPSKIGEAVFEDYVIRNNIERLNKHSSVKLNTDLVSSVVIDRILGNIHVKIFVSEPSLFINNNVEEIKRLEKYFSTKFKKKVSLKIELTRNKDINPVIIAKTIGVALRKEQNYTLLIRSLMSKAISSGGAVGFYAKLSGRLKNSTIASRDVYTIGSIPFNTHSCNIQQYSYNAITKNGHVGILVVVNQKKRGRVQ